MIEQDETGAGHRPAPAWIVFAVVLAGSMFVSVLGLVTAPPAHAVPAINLTEVCKDQYQQPRAEVRQLDGHNDAFSYYCFLPDHASGSASVEIERKPGGSVSFDWGGGTDLGPLNVQAWCDKHMGGLPATAWEGTNQWSCGTAEF